MNISKDFFKHYITSLFYISSFLKVLCLFPSVVIKNAWAVVHHCCILDSLSRASKHVRCSRGPRCGCQGSVRDVCASGGGHRLTSLLPCDAPCSHHSERRLTVTVAFPHEAMCRRTHERFSSVSLHALLYISFLTLFLFFAPLFPLPLAV